MTTGSGDPTEADHLNVGIAARESNFRIAWTIPEILMLCISSLYLLVYAWIASRGEPFWMDEVLGWMVGSDPSFRHMIYSWEQGADGGGISFYLLERLWFHLFGASDASYRIFSASGFAAGFAVTWIAARRLYSAGIVAVAMFVTWLFSSVLNFELVLARFYGLFLASAAVAVFAYIKAAQERRSSVRQMVFTFAANFLLVSVHVLGIVYSAALALALIVSDRFQRRFRPALYLSIFAAWLVLIPSRKAIVNTAKVGSPHFWIPKPYFHSLLAVYYAWSWPLPLFTVAAICVWWMRRKFAGGEARKSKALQVRHRSIQIAVWCFLVAWCAIPLVFFCYSKVVKPIFTQRYFLPMTIAITFAFAEILRAALPSWNRPRSLGKPLVWVTLLVLAMVLAGVDRRVEIQKMAFSRRGYSERIALVLPPGLPVVFGSVQDFAELVPRQNSFTPTRYRYLLDWSDALDPNSPQMEVTDYHLMENWKKVGYFANDIENADKFLGSTRTFVVVHDNTHKWLEHRVLSNSAYIGREIATVQKGGQQETIWLITRR